MSLRRHIHKPWSFRLTRAMERLQKCFHSKEHLFLSFQQNISIQKNVSISPKNTWAPTCKMSRMLSEVFSLPLPHKPRSPEFILLLQVDLKRAQYFFLHRPTQTFVQDQQKHAVVKFTRLLQKKNSMQPITWASCIAHCLPPRGLCQRQKNQGEEVEQDNVRGEPSLVIVPFKGNVDSISIPMTSLVPVDRRRRGRITRGLETDITSDLNHLLIPTLTQDLAQTDLTWDASPPVGRPPLTL